ncbi:hypothetical protein PUNSTDRAFT_118105 [Punctularia strigosozonata HHB-11173 SS5]|uniref:uncharacterized protein n=1 Tax=Punctularia strigosozonata (strain HHB-11173) TaxID=741275 RepID=UPI0004418497|nr:uncharacterized protein PUNSTDRAFT_118105 [Punctularia strigosozonata HHB-11173 SS5]EIN14696.1 hypothetical protein PUNSTDRAFT_118105 [Punctularia strigosozonata HHB-11173 SS5]
MPRCPELSRLPKAQRVASIKFRNQTPGRTAALIGFEPVRPAEFLDRNHPLASQYRPDLKRPHTPQWRSPDGILALRVFPRALLARPLTPWPNPPWPPASIYPSREDAEVISKNVVGMSVVCVIGKKTVHKSAVIRRKIAGRIKTALSLIVTRGADIGIRRTANGKELKSLTFDPEGGGGQKWVLSDWTYCFHPGLAIYRMTYPDLVSLLRSALGSVKTRAETMEKKWASRLPKKEPLSRALASVKPVPQLFFPSRKAFRSESASNPLHDTLSLPENEVVLSDRTKRRYAPVESEAPSEFPKVTVGKDNRTGKSYQLYQRKPLVKQRFSRPSKSRGQ